MTRKSTLMAWASRLGTNPPANATVAELERLIGDAINSNENQPQYTFSQAIQNNWQVLRAEVPSTARAIVNNLRS